MSTNSAKDTESKYNEAQIVTKLSSKDILCGRGAPAIKHVGNKIFRKVVKLNKNLHKVCTKKERYYLAESIVQVFEDETPPVRFLEQHPGSAYGEKWVTVSRKRAIRKTLQALREKESSEEDESSSADLIEVLCGEYTDEKGSFGQATNDGWGNMANHLVPHSDQKLPPSASKASIPEEHQEKNQHAEFGKHRKTGRTFHEGLNDSSGSEPYPKNQRKEVTTASPPKRMNLPIYESTRKTGIDFDTDMTLEDLNDELENVDFDIEIEKY
mmetsp:Transcript_27400/g.41480  ORF Transcript_27400/g.41480 Transcript_27400/m.41480 type:complete len:269 (+) Transcript_27400:139-945(+)|eukprot:CAMPEP_0178895412 /NCGR_PEP_ID=MMETSP0786-20121207/573_1 /TAXON_ID=186022 /ORGANISM="Thalassionema frauenfeldii, Strain CCMP 1798" /LENGTH=268 /DNA_ID=CAMNT_0020565641 /DNA_START=118 /DNA_END=924 /DNA_ORIENTATION=+